MRQTHLRTSTLGNTGMEITRIGFGAWVIGGEGWEFGWRPQQDDESIAAIHRALEGGVTPIGCGLLTGGVTRERLAAMPDDDWRKPDPQFTEPRLSRNLALASVLQGIAGRHDTTLGAFAVAIAWTLRNPAVTGASVGFRRPGQVDPVLPGANMELTEEDLVEIKEALA